VVWRHDFEFVYTPGDQPIKSPWLSGIGQANALLACLHWWRHTGEYRWKELASKALVAFQTPLNRSTGVAFDVPGGGAWFEEYPTEPPSHVLNCHLLCLNALHEAACVLESRTASALFESGWEALAHWLPRYDLGDWSRY